MNCLLVMKIQMYSIVQYTLCTVERSVGSTRAPPMYSIATVVGDDVIASTGYMKKQPISTVLATCPYISLYSIVQYTYVL